MHALTEVITCDDSWGEDNMNAGKRVSPTRPVVVYLDNQDYSVLANPKRHIAEPELPSLLAELRTLRETGSVKFVFSDVGVAEALPIRLEDVDLSMNQVRLLQELCGDHALITYGRLVREELLQVHQLDATPIQVLGGKYGWLPPGLERLWEQSANEKTLKARALELLAGEGLDQKSMRERLPIAEKRLRQHLLTQRKARIDRGEFHVLPKFQDVLLRAAVGEATAAEKKAAFLESWTDLEWLVSKHCQQPEVVNWFRDSVRSQNISGGQALRRFANTMVGRDIPASWRDGGMDSIRDEYLTELVVAASTVFDLPEKRFPIEDIRRYCPGLSAQAGVYFSFAWAHIASRAKKEISDSAAADAMHSVYAPYVDVFRTDKAMAPHVQRSLADAGTQVVRLRKDLSTTIRRLLLERQLT